MTNQEITICLTSCGRFDLLERTIKSLIEFWDGPNPKEFLIYEDSKDWCRRDGMKLMIAIGVEFPSNWKTKIRFFGKKVGQIGAIDCLYSKVRTPYIFHCEDDWEFYRPGFIQKSLDILEERPDVMQVWLREPTDRNGHPAIGPRLKTKTGTIYQMLKTDYRGTWSGWSFNPGLRRLSDYQKVGPYSSITDFNPKEPWKAEMKVGLSYRDAGFKAATLLNGFVRHIGNGRHIS